MTLTIVNSEYINKVVAQNHYRLKLLILVFAVHLPSAYADQNTDSSFDQMCNIITEFVNNKTNTKLPAEEQPEKLYQELKTKLPASSPAMDAYNAVTAADPKLKYRFFKEAAEESTGKKWHCNAMKEFNEKMLQGSKIKTN